MLHGCWVGFVDVIGCGCVACLYPPSRSVWPDVEWFAGSVTVFALVTSCMISIRYCMYWRRGGWIAVVRPWGGVGLGWFRTGG